MSAIYIGSGQRNKKDSGIRWKIFTFMFFFLVMIGSALKVSAPMIVERWINQKGANSDAYAFSVRDVSLSLEKGKMILRDVKLFNPRTNSELLEAPNLTINLNWRDVLLNQDKKVSISADNIDLFLSKDFSSVIEKIKASGEKQMRDFYLKTVEGKISKVNIIEQKEDQSRRILELDDMSVMIKEITPLSINKKTEFRVSASLADGGKLSLIGKTSEENGSTPWSISGSLKQVPADIFNKIAGDKLPFSFNEPTLNAEINAHSKEGKVNGEISPDITRLNLIVERPGTPTQSIARALTEELTFTLPFILKDEFTLQYADTFQRLKSYRKYPASNRSSSPSEAKVSQIF